MAATTSNDGANTPLLVDFAGAMARIRQLEAMNKIQYEHGRDSALELNRANAEGREQPPTSHDLRAGAQSRAAGERAERAEEHGRISGVLLISSLSLPVSCPSQWARSHST
jgi:hypothetical protein